MPAVSTPLKPAVRRISARWRTNALAAALALAAGHHAGAEPASPAASAAAAAHRPYDEAADARADLNLALQRAAAEHKDVLVVFGANWCPDCRSLAATMASDSPLARHIAERYVVTKVDVARFNKNTDLAQQMDNPIRKGIPAVAVLRGDGTLVKATSGGELADARQMGDAQVLAVLQGLEAQR